MAENEEDKESTLNQSEQTHVEVTNTDDFAQKGFDSECEPLVIGGIEVGGNTYHEAYRNGNFGVKRGRINFIRAKRWSVAHFLTALIMTCFVITCVILMVNTSYDWFWVSGDTFYWFLTIIVLCGVFSLVVSSCSFYLVTSLAKIRRPLFVLLLVRFLALLECLFVIIGIILTIIVASEAKPKNPYPWRYHYSTDHPLDVAKDFETFVVFCSLLIISMVVDLITTFAWLFHWWKCCDCCEALKSLCIFEPGEPLASGVSDPPTGIVHECAYVCWSLYRMDWTCDCTII